MLVLVVIWPSWFKIIKPPFLRKDVELTVEAKSEVEKVLKRKNADNLLCFWGVGGVGCVLEVFFLEALESFSVTFC